MSAGRRGGHAPRQQNREDRHDAASDRHADIAQPGGGRLLFPPAPPRPRRAARRAARPAPRRNTCATCAPSAFPSRSTRPCARGALPRSSDRRRACARSRPCSAERTRSMCSSTARRAWARPARRGWRWRRPSARRARPFARTRPLSRWTPPACALTSAPSPTRSLAASTTPSIRAPARWGRAACRSPRKAR